MECLLENVQKDSVSLDVDVVNFFFFFFFCIWILDLTFIFCVLNDGRIYLFLFVCFYSSSYMIWFEVGNAWLF